MEKIEKPVKSAHFYSLSQYVFFLRISKKLKRWKTLFFFFLLWAMVMVVSIHGYLTSFIKNLYLPKKLIPIPSYFEKIYLKIPYLLKRTSDIFRLQDVNPEELLELKTISNLSFKNYGPQFALALSNTNLGHPQFYLCSNFKEPVQLKLLLIGLSHTLISEKFYQKSFSFTLEGFSKTNFSYPIPLPQGKYHAYVLLNSSENFKIQPQQFFVPLFHSSQEAILIKKSYFLGGKKDPLYFQRLKTLHYQKKRQIVSEIQEIKKIKSHLFQLFHLTQLRFKVLRKTKANSEIMKNWEIFDKHWRHIYEELKRKFCTSLFEKKHLFYPLLWHQIWQAINLIFEIHQIHHNYFKSLEIRPQNSPIFQLQILPLAKNISFFLKI